MFKSTEVKAWHIVSEPGDATRYDYLMTIIGGIYYFQPIISTFTFPKYILVYEHDVEYLAQKWECNPWTVKECLRAIEMKQISEEDYFEIHYSNSNATKEYDFKCLPDCHCGKVCEYTQRVNKQFRQTSCGYVVDFKRTYKYCPFCGGKIKESSWKKE